MSKQRNRHTEEFKREAVRYRTPTGRSTAPTCSRNRWPRSWADANTSSHAIRPGGAFTTAMLTESALLRIGGFAPSDTIAHYL